MAANFEVAITSDSTDQLWNSCVWDITSGATLMTYKGGVSSPRTLNLIAQDYLVSAVKDKPLIHVWSLGRLDQSHIKMICPGKVTALAVSPDGSYCVAGIDEKLHVWQVSTGNLLFVNSRHYQPIRNIKFTDDSSHFVTAGEDAMVLVWSLYSVLSLGFGVVGAYSNAKRSEPRYIWSHHSLQVTDIYVGLGGARARVATASLDHTCKLYELSTGQLLLSIIMDEALMSVTMDLAEYYLFLGDKAGNIYQVNLFNRTLSKEINFVDEDTEDLAFIGHCKKVTCLSVSMDGSLLLSGSADHTARLWEVASKQCLKVFQHKDGVTNAMLIQAPEAILSSEKLQPSIPISVFKRHLHSTNKRDGNDSRDELTININSPEIFEKEDDGFLSNNLIEKLRIKDDGRTKSDLKDQVDKMKQVNHQLYSYSLNAFLDSISSHGND